MPAVPASSSMSLSITNPLVLYRALLSAKRIRPDPAQHRLAIELQKLYFRLKDYNPEIEYRWRLEKVARLSNTSGNTAQKRKAVFDDGKQGFSLSTLFGRDGRTTSLLAMTRTIPIHDSALEIDSPHGMLLYGEVGRGKSMLLDLLYNSLPTQKKRRWHFNTFILDIFRRLELARIERISHPQGLSLDHEHIILSLARDTMETSPILFMDEFQMPDRVSAKLVHSFFTAFFSLGGVLVASSNRMPEELAKASGIEFSRMDSSTRWGRGGQIWEKLSPGQQQARTDFGKFVEVLKQRCEVWEMEGERDYRRDGLASSNDAKDLENAMEDLTSEESEVMARAEGLSIANQETDTTNSADCPAHYIMAEPDSDSNTLLVQQLNKLNPGLEWTPSTLNVYNRKVLLQMTSTQNGVCILPFQALCGAYLGAADYISIASSFHTLVVTEVPILTLILKNEARRFITFLDACYEAHCRLVIEAAAPPDRLFFPETRAKRGAGNMLEEGDSIESEAFSEMYQDSTAPFRPNISAYHEGDTAQATTSLYNKDLRSVLADEDSDFGPTYGNGRGHGMSSDQAMLDERDSVPGGMTEHELRQGPDFTQGAGIFTGRDEQFAYKRARSRLWEMCGHKWWNDRADDPSSWWTPVHNEGRFWEKKRDTVLEEAAARIVQSDVMLGASMPVDGEVGDIQPRPEASSRFSEKDESLFRHGASPFRVSADPPPKFGWQHAWGMMKWGKKAGEWGKGVEGDKSKDPTRSESKE